MLLEVITNRDFFLLHTFAFKLKQEFLCARVESQHVVDQAPHIRVEKTRGLAEDCREVVPGPFKRAHVPRDRERHLRRENTFCKVRVHVQEVDEVRICARIEDNLSLQVSCL